MFKNLKIQSRLIILTSFATLMIAVVAFMGLRGIQKAEEGLDAMYEGGEDSIEHLNAIGYLYYINVLDVAQKVRDKIISSAEGVKQINETRNQIPHEWELYLQSGLNDEQKKISDQLYIMIKNAEPVMDKLQAFISQEDLTQLTLFIKKEMYPTFEPIAALLHQLILNHITATRSDYMHGLAEAHSVTILTIIVSAISIFLAIALAAYIVRSITKPLLYAVDVVNKVAAGDTSLELTVHSQDEIGQLLNAMQRMIKSEEHMANASAKVGRGDLNINLEVRSSKDTLGLAIKNMIASTNEMANAIAKIANGDLRIDIQPRSEQDVLGNALKMMVERLRHAIAEIQAEVQVLNTSNQEIVASVTQTSTSTAETAASVAETTTTVEELKQTAQVSTEKAQDVLSNAENTLKVVKSSEQSVNATIEDMNQIQEKMRVISDSIVKLSEHSLAIGEIINTVNDLAEQSNLLAVNAAIEAAKAGDQGKSFGVVAQEIRILAEQSKAATVQVRAILNDIRNATSATVMATEQGSKAVAKGVQQSSQTNAAIQSLSTSMGQAAQAAKQINISSQQQLIGVQQVTIAMTNISQASNQHVEHMKQIEQAVTALNAVGGTLKNLTDQYQLIKAKNS